MDRALIYDDGNPTTVRVRYDGCEISSREYPVEGTDWVALSAGHLDYDLEVKLPLFRGTLLGQSIFKLPSFIWRGRIADAAFVKVQCPPDWKCGLYLGTAAVPQNAQDGSFELGNFIKAYTHRERADALTLMLKNAQGQQEKLALARIAFEEYFAESPVSIEDGMLMWRPEGRYVGGDGDEFRLNLSISEDGGSFTYALDVKNAVVDRRFGQDCPCGEFPFRIERVGRQTLFGREADRVLFEGMLAIGAPEQRRVMNKCLYLTQARCWDLVKDDKINLEMPKTAGCLCDLQFQGYSIPFGESIEYPEYVGDLYFYNAFVKDWQYFNARESREYELINPVHVWIISDLMLILQTAEGEAPLIDRQHNSIVNRKLNLPNSILYNRLIQPDYFEYRME